MLYVSIVCLPIALALVIYNLFIGNYSMLVLNIASMIVFIQNIYTSRTYLKTYRDE